MGKRNWRISGLKGIDTIFDTTIPCGSITPDQLKKLLKCLAVVENKVPLDEIFGAYVKRKTKRAHDRLSVRSNTCGYNHGTTFIAIVVDENGKRIELPRPFT